MTRPVARVGRAAFAAVAALCLAAAGTPSTSTTVSTTGSPAPRLVLVGQDAWSAVGGTLTLRVRIVGAGGLAAGDSIAVIAHSSFSTRNALQSTINATGSQLGSTLGVVAIPLASLNPDSTGTVSIPLGLQDPTAPRDTNRLPLRRTGVYPLEIELRDASDRSIEGTRFVTPVVVVGQGSNGAPPIAKKLQVAWVWPLVAPPSRRLDDTVDPKVVAALQPDGRIGRQVAALGRTPGVPVTLVPTPETLEAWAALAHTDPALASGVQTLQGALATDQVLPGPYVPVDMGSLLDHDLSGAVDAELTRGQSTLNAFFGTRIDTNTAFARPASAAEMSRLRAANVDRVVLDESALTPSRSERYTRASPFLLQTNTLFSTSSLDALATDDAIGRLLTGDAPPALRAARFLADLSLVALEQPTVSRAVAIANPDDFDPGAALLDAVLTGLRDNPLLQPATVKTVFDALPLPLAGSPSAAPRPLAATQAPAPNVSGAAYFRAEVRLAAFQSLIGPNDPRIARGDRALLVSVTSAWKGASGRRRAVDELGVIDDTVNAFVADIHLPNPSTITLTSRSGEVPLTFRNDTGRPVRIRVSLASDKLAFPQGSVQDVDLGTRSTTLRVAVRARTSGTFPLRVTVTSVDGGLAIADTRFRIRSTAVSTLGIALMVGAGVFLAAWWAFDIRRRRRRRTLAAA
ncbi:MAG TPA: DUF6049 family protein [Acidimicrobiia bacterium]|nr:DUF6049 family protein [Acidimicrobiia bacterium]